MPTLGPDDARARFAAARVARLGTVSTGGEPHLVPVVFAVVDERVLIAIDQKPKRTRDLKRLRNIEAHASVSVLVDEYSDDWSALWWVRADGEATIRTDTLDEARSALAARYPQHAADPPEGPVIDIAVTRWSGWSAS